jgi:HD superfamily phosphohydrolase
MALEIRDPIHGFIIRRPCEQKIIDTKLFQRLRGIKQLALASLVYPGALHTRFEHCIGAMHIAGRVAHKLQLSAEESNILRLSALLHDIGHGPFSHVSEDVLEAISGQKKVHERLTAKIISSHRDLSGPLSGCDREEIVGLLEGKRSDSILKAILSGPLDVDKQDYLLRDSYFCGVKYGVYDLDRLLETLRVRPDRGDRFLAISQDGVQALEQFVIARYHMTGQVYRHRIRLITDSMIIRGITLGIELDKIDWLRQLYTYDDTEEFLQTYLFWDDGRLVKEMLDEKTPKRLCKTDLREPCRAQLVQRGHKIWTRCQKTRYFNRML